MMKGWPSGHGTVDDELSELITRPKIVDEGRLEYMSPRPGESLRVKLVAPDNKALKFMLNVFEGRRTSTLVLEASVSRKVSMSTRKSATALARVDLDERAVHTNPDGTEVRGPHLHLATVEYGDRFAVPLGEQAVLALPTGYDNPAVVFESFRELCGIDAALSVSWTLGV